MAIGKRFEQRKVRDEHGKETRRIASRCPSGPQQAGSPLLADLVEQLAFGVQVADFITHALIPTAIGAIEVDAYIESQADALTVLAGRARWAILVEDGPVRTQDDRDALRRWCAANRAELRILAESDIRTTFLDNVRFLGFNGGYTYPDAFDPALGTLLRLIGDSGCHPATVAATLDAMEAAGHERSHGQTVIRESIASGFIGCDLTQPFGNDAMLTGSDHLYEDPQDNRRDPILVLIMTARRE